MSGHGLFFVCTGSWKPGARCANEKNPALLAREQECCTPYKERRSVHNHNNVLRTTLCTLPRSMTGYSRSSPAIDSSSAQRSAVRSTASCVWAAATAKVTAIRPLSMRDYNLFVRSPTLHEFEVLVVVLRSVPVAINDLHHGIVPLIWQEADACLSVPAPFRLEHLHRKRGLRSLNPNSGDGVPDSRSDVNFVHVLVLENQVRVHSHIYDLRSLNCPHNCVWESPMALVATVTNILERFRLSVPHARLVAKANKCLKIRRHHGWSYLWKDMLEILDPRGFVLISWILCDRALIKHVPH